MNCDFSSNSNVWAEFYDFFDDHYEFCWVIFIMTDWLEFCFWVFGQPFWIGILHFRLQILEMRIKSPLSFCTFKYTYICLSNRNTLTCLSFGWMLYYCLRCRANVKTTLVRRFALAGITTVISIVKSSTWYVTTDHCEHARLVQWWTSVCKTGPTLKQH